jgi:hypothetical protein
MGQFLSLNILIFLLLNLLGNIIIIFINPYEYINLDHVQLNLIPKSLVILSSFFISIMFLPQPKLPLLPHLNFSFLIPRIFFYINTSLSLFWKLKDTLQHQHLISNQIIYILIQFKIKMNQTIAVIYRIIEVSKIQVMLPQDFFWIYRRILKYNFFNFYLIRSLVFINLPQSSQLLYRDHMILE